MKRPPVGLSCGEGCSPAGRRFSQKRRAFRFPICAAMATHSGRMVLVWMRTSRLTPFYLGPENRGYAEQPVEFGAVGAEKLAERDGEDLDGAAAALRAEAVFFGGEDLADADGGDEARPRDRRAGDERHDGAFRGYAVERRQHAALLGVVVAVLAAELVGGEGGALDGHVTAQLLARDGLRLARMAAERTAERNGGELGGREGRLPPTSSKTLISGRART